MQNLERIFRMPSRSIAHGIVVSFQFELQWMLIHCDPKRAQRESCSELPATEVKEHGLRSAQRLLRFEAHSGLVCDWEQREVLIWIYRCVAKHFPPMQQQVEMFRDCFVFIDV